MTPLLAVPSPIPTSRTAFGSSLLLAYLLFIVYGSLVPLDLHPIPIDEAWRRFQAMPFLQLGVESRADWIANGVLYAPLGFLAAWRLGGRAGAAVAAFALGVALALAVEFAQVFFPARTVSLNDVVAECIGSALGAWLALVLRDRGQGRRAAGRTAGSWLAAHGLHVFAAAYLAFCLFPFDLLISRQELDAKLASDGWGWWIAGQGRGAALVGLQLAIEVGLTLPFGVLLGQRAMPGRAPGFARAAAAGLVFGLAIEAAQLLIASGTSQGASVLSRVAGVVLGLSLWRHRARSSLPVLRAQLARSGVAWLPVYAVLVLAVNGWATGQWEGFDTALVKWRELRLLPFYYHYYTSESNALFSLASVFLMYLPLGLWGWAKGCSAGVAAGWGALAAAVVELGKLWLAGLHPDPTNILIAATSCWALVYTAGAWPSRMVGAVAGTTTDDVAGTEVSATASPPSGGGRTAALLAVALLPTLLYLVSAPAFALPTAVLLSACAVAVWTRPAAALLIVPAFLPALDLAAWTGRFFWGEFDLLLAVCLAIGYLRCPKPKPKPKPKQQRSTGMWALAFALLASSYAVSTFIGAMPWPAPEANSFASYYSPYNALRIAKGVVWAALFVGLLRRLDAVDPSARAVLGAGMSLGLAWVVGFVVWERAAFVGLLDFADAYRVTGPFSAMHRGGAFIECYIAVAVPFLAAGVIGARRGWLRWAGAALLVGASYAMMVTFSRNGYAAFAVSVLFMLWLARRDANRRQLAFAGLLVVATIAVAVPILAGPYARERLASWTQDLDVRRSHWEDALAMRDDGFATGAFGMGVGRFPQTHFWRSREPVRAGSFGLASADAATHLRLGAGARVYLDQLIEVEVDGPHGLKIRLKANRPAAVLDLSICEKWMLTSRTCVGASIKAADAAGAWRDFETTLDLTPLAVTRSRTVKFSVHTPSADVVIDVASIALQAPGGRELLRNGDFSRGMDRWFFSTDVDPPWHVHSLPVAVLFDQGWFGVVAWGVLIATALYGGIRAARAGDRHAAAALAALLAFLISGSLNTLIDEPRFLFLLIVVTALASRRESVQPLRSP